MKNSLLKLVVTLLLSVSFTVTGQYSSLEGLKSIEYYIETKLVSKTEFLYSENEEISLSIDYEENTVLLKVLSKKEDINIEVNYFNNEFVDSTIYRYCDGMLREKEVIYLPNLNRELPNAFSNTEKVITRYDTQGEIIESIFIDHFIGDTSFTHYEIQYMGDTLKLRKMIVDGPKFKMRMKNYSPYPSVSIDSFFYISHNLVRFVSYSNGKFTSQISYEYDTSNRLKECLRMTNAHSKKDFFFYKNAGKNSKKEVLSKTEVRGMIVENHETFLYKNDLLYKEIQTYAGNKLYEIVYVYDRNRRLVQEKKYSFNNGRVKKLYSEKIYKYTC